MNKTQSKTPLCDDLLEKIAVLEGSSSQEHPDSYYLEKIRTEATLQTARDLSRIAESCERLVQLFERYNRH